MLNFVAFPVVYVGLGLLTLSPYRLSVLSRYGVNSLDFESDYWIGWEPTQLFAKVLVFLFGVVMPLLLSFAAVGHETLNTFAKISLGSVAFSMMAINIILAARFRVMDGLFGGLDQVYWVHKWVGISLILVVVPHEYLGFNPVGQQVTADLANLAVDVAEWAYWPLLGFILLSFFKRLPKVKLQWEIPYHWWRQSHRFMGVIFAVFCFHQFFVKVPFDNNALLANYLNAFAIVGLFAFLWTQFGFSFRRRAYTVASVERHEAATIVDLKPVGRPVRVRPGGFAFVNFGAKGLREPHPFTVSKVGPAGEVQFSIRGLGDYTRSVRDLVTEGMAARVEGGYGRFDWNRGGGQQVWLAAGIGITPFLAWADSLPDDGAPDIKLIYVVRNQAEAVGLERLQRNSERIDSFDFTLFESDQSGRFNADRLVKSVPFEMGKSSLWFCGPTPMREAIVKDLKAGGASPKSIHFERFEFR